jgi:hypothetical protein
MKASMPAMFTSARVRRVSMCALTPKALTLRKVHRKGRK